MRHYCARQQATTGKWDFCCGYQPVGYCCGYSSLEDDPFAAKYHHGSHDTEEEACDCYLEYLLDNRMREWESKQEQRKCAECKAWTTHMVQVGDCWMANLCPEHATRELIKKHHGPIGEMWIS